LVNYIIYTCTETRLAYTFHDVQHYPSWE